MISLISKLQRTGLLTLPGLWYLVDASLTTGVNLMLLLRVAAKLNPDRIAVTDDRERLSYAQLWTQAETLAAALSTDYDVGHHQQVALVCRNHAAAIKAIFAVSRLGAHLFLLNPELSAPQLLALAQRWQFDFVIYDAPLADVIKHSVWRNKSLPAYHPTDESVERLAAGSPSHGRPLKKAVAGNIVVLTGGTTGQPKSASRKPSLVSYLPPFLALLSQAGLDQYRSLYITTPLGHGYGLAFLFIGVILGAELYVTDRFAAARAGALVAAHNIQVLIVVPLILQRLLQLDPAALSSVRCIITGSARLSPALAQTTLERLGPILFNLYGSSEAGFSIIAPPPTLRRKPESIGQPIRGVRAKIVNDAGQEVAENKMGQLCIRSRWTVNQNRWIATGDLAYRDAAGDIFLGGRVDEMIISGGENVYPVELENVIAQHPEVDSVAVVGIPDAEFGQRLKAVVVKKPGASLDPAMLLAWLKPRVARYQLPASLEFRAELPHTSLGKVDKKSLQG